MATPLEEEKKKTLSEETAEAYAGTVNALQGQIDTTKTAYGTYNQQIGEANKQMEDSFTKAALDYKEQLEKLKKENEDLTKREDQRNVFGAVTEFLGAFNNLYHVNRGATNTTIPQRSQDWMKEADAQREKRREKLDNIRERQQAAERQLEQLRAKNIADLATQNLQQTTNLTQMEAKKADTKAQGQIATASARQTEENTAYSRSIQREQLNRQVAAQAFSQQASMATNNLKFDDKGNIVVDYDAIANKAKVSGKGTGSNGKINLVLSASGDLPEQVIQISSKALDENIKANYKNADDLSDEDKKAIELAIAQGGNYAEKIKPFIIKSKFLRNVLATATGADASEEGNNYGGWDTVADPTGGAADYFED